MMPNLYILRSLCNYPPNSIFLQKVNNPIDLISIKKLHSLSHNVMINQQIINFFLYKMTT